MTDKPSESPYDSTKDAADLRSGKPYGEILKPSEDMKMRTIQENIELIENSANEWACGWNDSGCFYHFRKGNRGTGVMLEDFHQQQSYFCADDAETFEEAINMWVEYLIKKGLLKL